MRNWQELDLVSSKDNSSIKMCLKACDPKQARKHGYLLAEGLRQVEQILKQGLQPLRLLLADSTEGEAAYERLSPYLESLSELQVLRVAPQLLSRLQQTEQGQMLVLLAKAPRLKACPTWQRGERWLVLDAVQDPGNLGTMLRMAEAFAFRGVIFLPGTVWPFNDKAVRAAMGSLFCLELCEAQSADELQAKQYPLLLADLGGELLSSDLDLRAYRQSGFALVMGNEANGPSRASVRVAERVLTIPMPGRAESLNVAVAAGILAARLCF